MKPNNDFYYCTNSISDNSVQSIPFGEYRLFISVEQLYDRLSTIDLSEYFSKTEWNEMDAVDQHNWLDDRAQEWAESVIVIGWNPVKWLV